MPRKFRRTANLRSMNDIEAGLRQLTIGLRGLARDITRLRGNGKSARRRPVTPALRLQGRYMGLIRTLPVRKKEKVMAIRASKGVNEAIRAARELKR
jgi:hypothetical protein